MKDKLTLLILTCDKYSDLWDSNVHFLQKNWGNRDLDTFFVSDSFSKKNYESISFVFVGSEFEFSERIIAALKKVKTEYVLISLDDYFLTKNISNDAIWNLIEIMENENVDYVRLYKNPNANLKFKHYKGLFNLPLESNYEVNLYPGIWKKEFLLETFSSPMNAWEYEVSLTKIAQAKKAKCILSKRKDFPIMDVVRKGKYLHRAYRYLKRNRVNVGTRQVIPWKEEIRLFVFSFGKRILPKRWAIKVKKYLIRKGYVFYSDAL